MLWDVTLNGKDICTWYRLLLAVNSPRYRTIKTLINRIAVEGSAFEMSNAYLWETDLFFYGNTASLVSDTIYSLTRTIQNYCQFLIISIIPVINPFRNQRLVITINTSLLRNELEEDSMFNPLELIKRTCIYSRIK